MSFSLQRRNSHRRSRSRHRGRRGASLPFAAGGLLAAVVLTAPQLSGKDLAPEQVILAKELILEEMPGVPGAVQGKENTDNVYVRDSTIARDKFDLATKMEGYKEWAKAADLYQEVMTRYPDRVIPAGKDAEGVINSYTSVTRGVLARLCNWPQDGLDVYRGMYEPAAAELVASAKGDNLRPLYETVSKYFVTESGKIAGIRLIDGALESGEYLSAAEMGQQLLDLHPSLRKLAPDRPGVLFRTALAYHLAGQPEKARERAQELSVNFPRDMGVIRGRDAVLVDALGSEMKNAPAATIAGGAESYPMFGGNAQRSLVSSAKASAGTPLYSVPMAKAEFRNISPQMRVQVTQSIEMAANNGLTLGVIPAVDRGELFFQDGQRVYAVSLASGVPLPGWAQTYGPQAAYTLNNTWGTPKLAQQTLTLTARDVLAVMGQPDRQTQMLLGMGISGEARLVCLDRSNGREKWTVALSTVELPKDLAADEQRAVKALQFSGSPLVVGDSVLVTGRSNKAQTSGQQGEDCYLLSFDLASGKFRWSCYIASSGPGAGAMFGVQPQGGDSTSHPAYSNGKVYVCTNLGAIAALDAYSGTIVWLNLYPTDRPEFMNPRGAFIGARSGGNVNSTRLKPWEFDPVLIQDGKVFSLPTDGKFLMVYEAASGKEIKRINLQQLGEWSARRNASQREKPTTLVGVMGDRMIVAGERRLLCFNWKMYEEKSFPGNNDEMIFWPSTVVKAIRGRPFMTADAVFVPTDERVLKISMTSGLATDTYPKSPRRWEDTEGPGNVVVAGDHVVIAGHDSVDVYTDLTIARQKLDAEVAASPNDPEPRLRYAEVMFVAGQTDAARQRLDEAIALLGGMEHMRVGAARDRVFNDALTFAQKLAADQRRGSADSILAMFDRAGAAAVSPQQQVYYRMSRAKYAESQKDPAEAVKLYQEILLNDTMRPVALLDEQAGTPSQAEDVAEKSIEQLIRTAGAGVYAPYQKQAEQAMTDAQGADNLSDRANKLMAVAQAYPNSGVAPKALFAAADAYESAKQPRSAVRVLRQMWFDHQQGANRAEILEALARNYLAVADRNRAEMISTAAARLNQGANLPGAPKLLKPLKLPDGTVVADAGTEFSKALEEVRRLGTAEAGKTLPDFKLPVVPTPAQRAEGAPYPKPFVGQKTKAVTADVSRQLPNATVLVLPAREFARPDRVVTWSDAGTQFFPAGELKAISVSQAFPDGGKGAATDAPRGVAWSGDTALVWGSTKLVSVDSTSGKSNWEIDLARLQAIDVVRAADTGSPTSVANVMGGGDDVVFIDGNQVIMNRGVARGRVVVNGRLVAPGQINQPVPVVVPVAQPAAPVAGIGEQVVEVRPVGERVLVSTSTGRLLSVDLASGRIGWQTRLAEKTLDRLVATEDFTAVLVRDDLNVRLFALDTYKGRMLGSKVYPIQNGLVPVNLALAPDGTLVYTLPDRLVLKDLYKPWNDQEREVRDGPAGQPVFAGATQAGQLLIAEGRILALADNGNVKYVRIHSLETGAPLKLRYRATDGSNKEVDQLLSAETKEWNVMLRAVGPHLYVIASNKLMAYNLDQPAQTWRGTIDGEDVNFRDAFIGQRHLVLLDQPAATEASKQGYRLHAFGRETGRLDYPVAVSDPAGIAPQWQAADGSFYYATVDGKVRMLKGAADH